MTARLLGERFAEEIPMRPPFCPLRVIKACPMRKSRSPKPSNRDADISDLLSSLQDLDRYVDAVPQLDIVGQEKTAAVDDGGGKVQTIGHGELEVGSGP